MSYWNRNDDDTNRTALSTIALLLLSAILIFVLTVALLNKANEVDALEKQISDQDSHQDSQVSIEESKYKTILLIIDEQKELILHNYNEDKEVKSILLDNLNEMSILLRGYGLDLEDVDDRIYEEDDTESEILVEESQSNYIHLDYVNTNSTVMNPSGLSAEQIDGLIWNTNLCGIGEAVKQIEDEYGVNAFYTLGVCSLESGYGSSSLALHSNNIFGVTGFRFNSFDECVLYFGKLMDKYSRVMPMNISTINGTYCTNPQWKYDVVKIMNDYISMANNSY